MCHRCRVSFPPGGTRSGHSAIIHARDDAARAAASNNCCTHRHRHHRHHRHSHRWLQTPAEHHHSSPAPCARSVSCTAFRWASVTGFAWLRQASFRGMRRRSTPRCRRSHQWARWRSTDGRSFPTSSTRGAGHLCRSTRWYSLRPAGGSPEAFVSARHHALVCLRLRTAPANQPLSPRWPAISGLFSTCRRARVGLPHRPPLAQRGRSQAEACSGRRVRRADRGVGGRAVQGGRRGR